MKSHKEEGGLLNPMMNNDKLLKSAKDNHKDGPRNLDLMLHSIDDFEREDINIEEPASP